MNLDRGKGLTVWGIVLTVIFGIALTGFPAVAMSGGFLSALAVMSPVIGFFGGGLAMIWAGTQRTKKAKALPQVPGPHRQAGEHLHHHPGPGHAGVGAQGL